MRHPFEGLERDRLSQYRFGGIRCILWPITTLFVWYLWVHDGCHLNLILIGAIAGTLLGVVFAMW